MLSQVDCGNICFTVRNIETKVPPDEQRVAHQAFAAVNQEMLAVTSDVGAWSHEEVMIVLQ